MSKPWRWLSLVLVLSGAVLLYLLFLPATAPNLIVSFVSHTLEPTGQVRVTYEITNASRDSVHLHLVKLETRHPTTGWWQAHWRYRWDADQQTGSGGRILRPVSATRLELISSRPALYKECGVRGTLRQIPIERTITRNLRKTAEQIGVPRSWLPMPKPVLIKLNEVEFPPEGLRAPESARTRPDEATVQARNQVAELIIPAGMIKFVGMDLRAVLEFYSELAEAELVIDSIIRESTASLTLENTNDLKIPAALQFMERALRDQAGIEVKRLDSRRISVTPVELLSVREN